jgi:hypothetical protein
MLMRIAFVVGLIWVVAMLAVAAHAKEFPVSDQDQVAILTVCDLAAQSPTVPRDMRANIAGFCLAWQRRIEAASAAPPPKEDGK